MISKNKIKQIRSLTNKREREISGLFLVEGEKICLELLASCYQIESMYYTRLWGEHFQHVIHKYENKFEWVEVSEDILKKISALSTPNKLLAVVKQKNLVFNWSELKPGPVLLLDQVQDPGNLGTIIRTADWFGIQTVVASQNTTDVYNPKVIQSAMGSVFRISCFKYDLEKLLIENREKINRPVFSAVLNGKSIYDCNLMKNGFYLFGNEANGVSIRLQSFATELITIPNGFTDSGKNPVDSLNIAIAASIIVAEINRQNSSGSDI